MTHHQLGWEAVMNRAGRRVTRQRTTILDAVCAGNGHTTIGEIFARARRADPAIDQSTVYRALRVFSEVGLVHTGEAVDGERIYAVRSLDRHHHLRCRVCGNEQQIDEAAIAPIFKALALQFGFEVESDHLLLNGRCAACRASDPTSPA